MSAVVMVPPCCHFLVLALASKYRDSFCYRVVCAILTQFPRTCCKVLPPLAPRDKSSHFYLYVCFR
ncbi:uncharacterized protein LY79DRAFT_567627 [Colletotrichum navitas]|uniref:Uncharacterized protein n=1 Tax=Colletotrichum navitas TaxID=681940 RepID=A0AAD8V0Y8_9PEZI|nr:uncharacterized protein LY79DRAFT_567627 [Colletotrichum navitas]KAK1573795.1 hypothetical protein LY79DRAFT_567627 [Colletotrichum navitas]